MFGPGPIAPIAPSYSHGHHRGDDWDGDYEDTDYQESDGGTEYKTTYRCHYTNANPAADTKTILNQRIRARRRKRAGPSFPRSSLTNQPIANVTKGIVEDANAEDGLYQVLQTHDPRRWAAEPDAVLRQLLEKHLWGESLDNRRMIETANRNHADDVATFTRLNRRVTQQDGHILTLNTTLPQIKQRIHNTRQKLRRELADADNVVRTDFATADTALDARIAALEAEQPRLIANDACVQYQLANLREHINNLHLLIDAIIGCGRAADWRALANPIGYKMLPYDNAHTRYQAQALHPLAGERANRTGHSAHDCAHLQQFYTLNGPEPIGPQKT
jgi:uncharacterized coiled-coil protein SlyX